MTYLSRWLCAVLICSGFIWVSQDVLAHHSYLLTVQQLRAGLTNLPRQSRRVLS
jgi:hypothetical protein